MSFRDKLRTLAKKIQSRSRLGFLIFKFLYLIIAIIEIIQAYFYFLPKKRCIKQLSLDFIVIGAQKTGTSWLDKALRDHPDLTLPRNRKEVHYYDSGFWKGTKWYKWNFRSSKQNSIKGEITPAYSTLSSERIEMMAKDNPNSKIIFILRNPIERAYSMAYMDLIKTPRKKVSDVDDMSFYDHFAHSYSLTRGNYSSTIKKYSSIFGKEMPYIFFYDDICSNPDLFLLNFLEIVGANTNIKIRDKVINARVNVGGTKIPEKYEIYLNKIYDKEISELKRIIKSDRLPKWLQM